ncbi:MAG: SulP family inorganic anion transporter [Bacteroidota bacterium]
MKVQGLLKEFHLESLLPSLTAGLVIGTSEILFSASLAALIFSGSLTPFVARGIGLLLFGGMVVGLAVAFFSSLPGAIPVPQDSPAAILAVTAAAIAAQIPAQAAPDRLFFTVIAAISFTTIAAGLLFIAVGRFGWSSIVRFVPYPVVGGFLAGTGWLLTTGAMSVLSGLPMGMQHLPRLLQGDILMRWLPGALMAVLLLVLVRRFDHPLIMLGMLLGGTALFYIILFATHTTSAEAEARGLLLGPFPSRSLWEPLKLSQLALVDWRVLLGQTGKLVTVLMVSTIALLLNANALELATRRDIDLNHELVAAGAGNLLGGLAGSPVGYQTVSSTALAYQMGGGNRLTTLIVGLMSGGALLFGASFLSFFPKAVIGGLLLFLGLSFLVEWLYDSWRRLPHIDYFLVLVILGIVAAVGFLQGVGAGILIAAVLFVVNYSRMDFVKDTLTGLSYHSNVERPLEHSQLIRESSGQIHILRLQGYLFFGTAQNLLNRVRERLQDASQVPLRFLLLDFQHVTALDSSAALGFVRLHQLADANQIHLVMTALRPRVRERLAQGGLVEGEDGHFHVFSSLDHGMEWCEDQLLAGDSRTMLTSAATLQAQLGKVFSSPEQIDCFMNYLERIEVPEGHVIIDQGDPADAMYFVDSGQVTAELETAPGEVIRLRTMGGGTVVGEMGLYLRQTRTARVFTTQPSVLYRLSETSLHEMEHEDPVVASALHQWMVRLLAHRLTDTDRTLEVLLG